MIDTPFPENHTLRKGFTCDIVDESCHKLTLFFFYPTIFAALTTQWEDTVKRKLSRVDFKIDSTIRANEKEFQGELRNISLNGLFIKLDRELKPGIEVEVSVALSSVNTDMTVVLKGIVVRCEEEGVAIQFKDIELDSFILLRNIVIYNSGDSDLIDREFEEFIQNKTEESTAPAH